jgi:hypothetical protein
MVPGSRLAPRRGPVTILPTRRAPQVTYTDVRNAITCPAVPSIARFFSHFGQKEARQLEGRLRGRGRKHPLLPKVRPRHRPLPSPQIYPHRRHRRHRPLPLHREARGVPLRHPNRRLPHRLDPFGDHQRDFRAPRRRDQLPHQPAPRPGCHTNAADPAESASNPDERVSDSDVAAAPATEPLTCVGARHVAPVPAASDAVAPAASPSNKSACCPVIRRRTDTTRRARSAAQHRPLVAAKLPQPTPATARLRQPAPVRSAAQPRQTLHGRCLFRPLSAQKSAPRPASPRRPNFALQPRRPLRLTARHRSFRAAQDR